MVKRQNRLRQGLAAIWKLWRRRSSAKRWRAVRAKPALERLRLRAVRQRRARKAGSILDRLSPGSAIQRQSLRSRTVLERLQPGSRKRRQAARSGAALDRHRRNLARYRQAARTQVALEQYQQELAVHWRTVRARSALYAELIRLNKPIGWLLLLWPTLWALWLANEGVPSLHLLLVFVLGVFITRSAGVAVNDLADRDFDPFVERTKNRPLAAGRISPKEAYRVIAGLTLCAFLLVLTTNGLTVLLSIFAVCLTLLYPLMKRYTYLPQVFLGFAFSWGIPMAFAASTNGVPALAWLIFATNMLWVLAYDTMYAMVDREDDIKIGVKSTAILLDDADRLVIGVVQIMFIVALYSIGHQTGLGAPYYLALAVAGALLAYQQYLIHERIPERCFKAFLNNNRVGLVIFVGIALTTAPFSF